MHSDRRSFLSGLGAASLGLPLLETFALASQRPDPLRVTPHPEIDLEGEMDMETLRFWTQRVRSPLPMPPMAAAPSRGETQPVDRQASLKLGRKTEAPLLSTRLTNEPRFYFFDGNKGFRKPHMLDLDGLPARGDLDVTLQVLECRPSVEAYERFARMESGSLRIDFQQATPPPTLVETLAWTALGILMPDAKAKNSPFGGPTFDLGRSWGKTQRIPLPEGLGYWTWNFFLKEEDSPWTKFLKFVRAATSQVAASTIVGLPAIGKSALQHIDGLLGRLQAQKSSRWMLQSPDMELFGTRMAAEKVGPRALQLRTGEYLLVPSTQVEAFEQEMEGLALIDGRLVPKSTGAAAVNRIAATTLPEVTYLTLHVGARSKPICKCPPA